MAGETLRLVIIHSTLGHLLRGRMHQLEMMLLDRRWSTSWNSEQFNQLFDSTGDFFHSLQLFRGRSPHNLVCSVCFHNLQIIVEQKISPEKSHK
ncbi:MAG: hypothetical protein A3C79_02865 [Candidatus Taylorbacteria bacterium RIFCSPHIGHO2_02_FULL_45_28]|uniref:Uncharacterized protein n=1 Tax=Candidatus Taylorbacteria bacterium RIFCSPHIGHO2_12_FULL_45_16 TaxID=1802315 RepID=A0A1G2N382_9BACT|nr:MAG: hypothetical protein A2830_00585 [Candidatus Taylorbacteria bacterium RIFCSPHIGHO2_01_FULL_44_110]OHA24903.1 MAG: hypothetical protein A3C79_02865 [Candidatus Taylorbacteria bacterium RIFCSPHIGHO2_02_FULL_45_28]OHA29721.1 MAG: hypothetical protein A3F51_03280 [Candidatus Taylorbacteria bacterium RIFCSPHIGHO2_12_FULL_45_16]OHA32665.1 MAG: hypothetical protein A3A23_00150 [Candidatus Taylorbacteria bacterium RIFCSPLOWO2_01_FULL_45_59]OHA38820.1 MAG: hypothetical protein A3I98_01590 [Candi